MKHYYDPEYDRIVDENEVKRQYEWFSKQAWFSKSLEDFTKDNFDEVNRYKVMFIGAGYECIKFTFVYARTEGEALRKAEEQYWDNEGHEGWSFCFDEIEAKLDNETYFHYFSAETDYTAEFTDWYKARDFVYEFGGIVTTDDGKEIFRVGC